MNTAYRECEQRRNEHVDSGMLTHALSLPRRIATSEVPATSEKWGFLGVLIYARGDSLAENRAM